MTIDGLIFRRVNLLKIKASTRYNIAPEKCHVGHLALEGLLEKPDKIHQIDGATGDQETNLSIAKRSMQLADALHKFGLKPGDPVIIMGRNHLDLAVPYYACHYMGYSMCSIDPSADPGDLLLLYPYIKPKFVFCQKECVEKNNKALELRGIEAHTVTFDDNENDLESFKKLYKGTEKDFRITPNAEIDSLMVMSSTQWLSALIFYIATPIKGYTRLQSSVPLSPQILAHMINTYKPQATAWTPFLLARFIQSPDKVCDLSSFKHILVGGSSMEKHIIDDFKKICNARLHLCYGMTELLVGIFVYNEDDTPFGSSGKAQNKYQYRLIDKEGQDITETHKGGELWVKGDAFFKGYLNNPEETKKILTEDGWVKTGDIFYRDENDYYFFVERKKLLIRYLGYWVSPLQVEEVIKRHPKVSEACVVGIPNPETMEIPVAAVMNKNGGLIDPQEIFDLVNESLPEIQRLHGGMFFIDSFPTTPSGKVNRAKLTEIAKQSIRIMAKNS